jgi:hypothetical protein
MKLSLNHLRILFIVSLFIPSLVSTHPKFQETNTSLAVEAIAQTLARDELYFGMSLPDGKILTEAQWQQFLNDEITPRFREGLTVLNGYGQYLDSSGKLLRENTKVVILVYQPSLSKERSIQEMIKKYKQKFQQESVLRVTSQVQATF